jgi:GDPmannose 4,6-dehydratase
MRALIVGHCGQDGSYLWEQLRAREAALVGLSRRRHDVVGTAVAVQDDWQSARALRALVQAFEPDHVYYLAACHHSAQQHSEDDAQLWERSFEVHVAQFQRLLDAVVATGLGTRIFYAASSRIFGSTATAPQNEDTPRRPECIYGLTKSMGMMLADFYRRTQGMAISCGILYNHESPRRGSAFVSQRIVEGLVAHKLDGAPALRLGSLSARVDWGYAPDYTLAMQRIVETAQAQDFIIASGATHAVGDWVRVAAEYLDLDWRRCVSEDQSLLRRPSQELCGDITRLRQATGWRSEVSFESMVRLMVDAALARRAGPPTVS